MLAAVNSALSWTGTGGFSTMDVLSEPEPYVRGEGGAAQTDSVYRSFLKGHSHNGKLRELFCESHIDSKGVPQFRGDVCELLNKQTLDKTNKKALQQFFRQRGYNRKESLSASRTIARRYEAGALPDCPSVSLYGLLLPL